MILNENLKYEKIAEIIESNYGFQHTIKYLQSSQTGNKKVDKWIKKNKRTLTEKEKRRIENLGGIVDKNCMNTKNRYIIFRIDGKIYKT